MMRKKALIVIGTLLFCLSQIGVNYLIYKYKNNNVEIPKVQLKDVEENKKINKNTFAVMLEQTDGTYTQSNSSVWPGVGYLYNGELSGCIDNQGNAVENAISFNDSTKTATVRTNGTIYCYLYFKGVAPTSGSISINNNATYTTSTGVTLTLSAIDASEMCISNTTSCTSWENYSTSKNWPLSSGDGTKTVYVTYRNASGKTIGPVTDTIILDTISPTSGSIKINNNATYTTSTSITLTLSASGASKMCISNTTSCSSWENYATSKSWTLSSGDGTKTVYVWYKDDAGNSTNAISDTIILDTASPSLIVSAPTGTSSSSPTVVSSASYTVSGTVSDATSKVKSVTVNGSAATISGSNYTKVIILTEGTTTTVTVVATDNAGKTTTLTRYVKYVKPTTSGSDLITKANLNNEGGLYRYQGTTANNYVCFGTSTKATCVGNTDAYMYRIMGVNSSGQMKLIKKEALNTAYMWYSTKSNRSWEQSTLFTKLNGSNFLSNTTYIPNDTWKNKIATMNWKYGDVSSVSATAASLYSTENGWTATVSAKIGLMYAHDYAYGLKGGNNCSSTGAYGTCKTSWLYLFQSQNDSNPPDTIHEWTMSRYGEIAEGGYGAWAIRTQGYVNPDSYYNDNRSVRPVFFLNSSVVITSGTGTLSDPYILS